MSLVFENLLCALCMFLQMVTIYGAETGAKFYNTPMHEVTQYPVYLGVSPQGEIVVTYTGKGSDLRPDDYITHADDVKVLSGSLADFLASGDRETILPVIDDEDTKFGGHKLLGFVMIQSVLPRKLQSRRGEIVFDMEEGGPAPEIQVGNVIIGGGSVKTTDGDDYKPPPHGGGNCITARDCYYGNGTCSSYGCQCIGDYTGSYCQLYRPQTGTLLKMKNKKNEGQPHQNNRAAEEKPVNSATDLPKPPPEQDDFVKVEYKRSPGSATGQATPAAADAEAPPEGTKKRRKRKPGAKKAANTAAGDAGESIQDDRRTMEPPPEVPQQQQPPPPQAQSGPLSEEARMAAIQELYGPGKAYPEPYLAGKVPANLVHHRHKSRIDRTPFVYAVRFRSGPFGLSFDNRKTDCTVVERVLANMQAQLSDVQVGDYLIAVDQFNTTNANPKDVQRLTNSLPWPRILVFETKGNVVDPKMLEKHNQQRTLNVSVLYPPTLTGDFQMRVVDWTPLPSAMPLLPTPYSSQPTPDSCALYYLMSPQDPFGCEVKPLEFQLPEIVKNVIGQRGNVNSTEEAAAPMLTAILKESYKRRIPIHVKPAVIMKRGVCSFVSKAMRVASDGAGLALMVNQDDTLPDTNAGKENTTMCTAPFATVKESDGKLVQLTAATGEVLVIAHESLEEDFRQSASQSSCIRLHTLAEDIIDQWPHSVPHIPIDTVLQNKAPGKDKLRGPTDEGGRIAIAGENGWAFFDYHLAMFGPQEVPLGAYRMQVAMPPHGCDPNAYTVRIKDTVVAILRGGGCSFGIKVINAQKLGAKAVIIVNTDDKKTMRLMAMPDEEPLIHIPCITVSRRLQFYLESQLKFFYTIDQHIISIQPTGLFGDYENRNTLELPQRLPGR